MPISSEAKQTIQKTLDDTVAQKNVPGMAFVAIDKKGEYIAEAYSGQHGQNQPRKVDADSVFWIASCTKMIVGIAVMQLVEKGKLSLDDPQQLYLLLPEVEQMEVLTAPGKLEKREGDITMRMLLSHTAGFGYTFFSKTLRDHGRPTGFDEFSGDFKDVRLMPLIHQPNKQWEYGTNIDWAGLAVERASGLKLHDYFHKHIFEPLGIKNISFFPDKHMREHLMAQHQRLPDGSVVETEHSLRRALYLADEPDVRDRIFCSGGAGCFAKPKEYCQILAMLLNNGTSPTTGKQVLKPDTVGQMFTNQIPQLPDFARNDPIPQTKKLWTNPVPELFPQEGNPPQGWGLSFMLPKEGVFTGRAGNSGWWAGIVNLFWWCDREKGIAGIIGSQILPFGDPDVMGAWLGCEKAVYDGYKA